MAIANNAGSSGSYDLQGGTLSTVNLLVNTGGTFKFDGGSLVTSNVVIAGGVVTASGDETATALTSSAVSYSQTGGSNSITGALKLGNTAGSTDSYDLKGGTLQADMIDVNNGGSFKFDGGFLQANQFNIGLGANVSASGNEAIGTQVLFGRASYLQTAGSNSVTGALELGVSAAGSDTYLLGTSGQLTLAATLTAGAEMVGLAGSGAFTQDSGANSIASSVGTITLNDGSTQAGGSLVLGAEAKASGSYTLNGGTLQAGTEVVGASGRGAFTQTGGSNTTTTLTLAQSVGATGSYDLKGGTLSAGTINVNYGGSFKFDGGFLQANQFNIGLGANVSASGNEAIDTQLLFSHASYLQTAGSNSVTGALELGVSAVASDSYSLGTSGLFPPATTLTAGAETFGLAGSGGFTQDSGTNTIASSAGTIRLDGGSTQAGGSLVLGAQATASGSYTLNGGSLQANSEVVGASGSGTFTQSGGGNTTGVLTVAQNSGASGSYDLKGGSLSAGTVNVNDGGSFKFDGGSLQANQFNIGAGASVSASGNEVIDTQLLFSRASYLQTGGSNSVTGALELGVSAVARDTYSLGSTALLNPPTTLIAGAETVGLAGSGAFTQYSGANSIASSAGTITLDDGSTQAGGSLVLGAQANASGSYTLNGGTLQAGTEVVGASGGGTFTQSSGYNTVDALTVAQNSGASGSYTLQGGMLSAANVTVNAGGALQVTAGTLNAGTTSNGGTVSLRGGTTNFNGTVTNQAAGTFTVANGATTFKQAVVNDGMFQVQGGTVIYAGSFTNNGTMVSDPSTQTFSGDLIESTSGVIQASAGDVYAVGGGFLNYSTQNTKWNTLGATLEFTSEGTSSVHTLLMTGTNLGTTLAAYNDNFAWGTLSIDAGQSVSLETGTGSDDVAFYVENLVGAMIAGDDITNIDTNGFDIFYNPHTAENDYLEGGTFDLAGGGELIADQAAQVPEPASLAILLSGLAALAAAARRQRRPAARGRS